MIHANYASIVVGFSRDQLYAKLSASFLPAELLHQRDLPFMLLTISTSVAQRLQGGVTERRSVSVHKDAETFETAFSFIYCTGGEIHHNCTDISKLFLRHDQHARVVNQTKLQFVSDGV